MTCLRALHPSPPDDRRTPPLTSGATALQVTRLEVKAAITSFPQGSAAGPDGVRPQHFKDLLAGKDDNDPLLLYNRDHQLRVSRQDPGKRSANFLWRGPHRTAEERRPIAV